MGVPDFEGDWTNQTSQWKPACVRQAAFALSLAHVINEMKRELVCPLAVREIWAYWDADAGNPKGLKLAVQWGDRAPVSIKKEGERFAPMAADVLIEQAWDSREFWAVSAHERDEGILTWPFPKLEVALSKKGRRFSLLYRDTRVSELPELAARSARLWRARRATLREAGGEVADLFRQVGAAIAYAALPMPSQRLTLMELRDAREEGMGLAIEALIQCAAHLDARDAEIEYDFTCREAGERAVELGSSVMCMAYLQGFFMALGDNKQWARVAGGGEQEVLFGLLCRLEPIWGESLDAMARSRIE